MLKAAEKRKLTDLVQKKLHERPDVCPFPAAVSQLLAACQDPNATAITFEKIIECDPALSLRLLRMANSSLYGLTHKVESLRHASVVLGIRQLKSLALSFAGVRMFAQGPRIPAERQAVWSHSLGCATVARLIADSVPEVYPDDAFLAGILHDVGKLLLLDVAPEEYALLTSLHAGDALLDEERFVFGVSHEEIGLQSAHGWGLSEELKAAIGFHHRPEESPVHFEYAAVVQIADSHSKAWGIGSQDAVDAVVSEETVKRLGLDDARLAGLHEQAQTAFAEMTQIWAP